MFQTYNERNASRRWGRFRRRDAAATAVLLLVAAGAALAQTDTGNLYGTARDPEGAPLPGVSVTLSGQGSPRVQVTDDAGNFRFLALSPGNYSARAHLEGFSPVDYPNVNVRVALNTSIEITMSPAVEEVITVTAESPLLDRRSVRRGTTVTEIELEKIPTSRDPWAVLTQTPGVMSDRINVGGNESGQQASFSAPGQQSNENVFAVDGVVITDMAAVGASPTYYDFDAFEEMQVTTGGTDVSISTPGVALNLVTKRGTNDFRGTARYYLTDGDWQSDPSVDRGDAGPGQDLATFSANRINELEEIGGEIGGPLWRDHLWFWGSLAENDIRNIVAGGSPDDTTLENEGLKVNAQLESANSAVVSYQRGDKLKFGRSAGPTRPPETTWNQSGPTTVYKVEDTHVFGSNFFVSGLYSVVDGGFGLAPQGGLDADWFVTDDGVYHGTYLDLAIDRDVTQYRADGSYFFNTGEATHELKFGGGYREAETSTLTAFPRGRIAYGCEVFGCDPDVAARPYGTRTKGATVFRDAAAGFTTEYTSAWLQDTLTSGNLTASIGVRYDVQEGVNTASGTSGTSFGGVDFFPALEFPGNDAGDFSWDTFSPRLGISYAIGEGQTTLLRASYGRYAQQLAQGFVSALNPVGPLSSVGFFDDANNDGIFNDAEAPSFLSFFSNFDPAQPFADADRNDPDLQPAITDSLTAAVDHAFLPEFVGSASVTYSRTTDIIDAQRLVSEGGATRLVQPADWVPGDFVTEEGVPILRLRDGVSSTGGFFNTNGDRESEALIVSLAATKRLANRWSMRGSLTWSDTSWDVPDSFLLLTDPNPTLLTDNGNDDGGIVVEQSAGSGNKGGIWLNAEWTFNLNGIYQVAPDRPWGLNVGANLTARQGYPNPEFRLVSGGTVGDGINRSIRLADVGDERHDTNYQLDLHVDKEFDLYKGLGLTVSADVFNVTNEATVLQRQRSAASSQFRFITETSSPRIARLGVRFTFE